MNELGTALREAAASAGQTEGESPETLWQQGRRRVRRRRVGGAAGVTAAVVAAAVLAGVQPWSVPSREASPIGTTQQLRLPDEFHDPSPWLPGTEQEGELGPLVVLLGAERRSLVSSEMGLVGVSGSTGEYRYLDLEGYGAEEPDWVTLSPDGRQVAWWKVSGEPVAEGLPRKVTALAVYDTVTGQVVEFVPEDLHGHGVSGGDLQWSEGMLWFDYRALSAADGTRGTSHGPFVWDATRGSEPVRRHRSGSHWQGSPDGAALVVPSGRNVVWLEPNGERRTVASSMLIEGRVAVGPGGHVAALRDTDGASFCCSSAYPLAVGLPANGRVVFEDVPGVSAEEVLGWRDEHHVVVRRHGGRPSGFLSVDVRDGSTERLSTPMPTSWSPGTVVAADAWQAPVYDAPQPDRPLDRRAVLGLGVVPLVAGAVLLRRWRRRVR